MNAARKLLILFFLILPVLSYASMINEWWLWEEEEKRVDPFQYLGARVEGLTPYLAQKLGVKKTRGVVITYVAPESPADKLRLRKGDMIVEINGRSIEDLNDYQEAITDTLSSFAIKERDGNVKEFFIEYFYK